jgi:hydroxysqualene synthase
MYLTRVSLSNAPAATLAWTITAVGIGHYENFPVASILCPPRLRDPIRSIYAFARTADDIADEGDADAAQRLRALARYRAALHQVAQHLDAEAPVAASAAVQWSGVFRPLARVLREFRLPVSQLDALLDAFAQDVANPRYDTRAQLLDYCERSANPVGRLLLHLYGVDDEASLRASDAICTALQLINFWQDLSIDLPRGRVYLPQEDCRRFGVSAQQLGTGSDDAGARALVADLVLWAGSTMARGATLPPRIPGRAGWELRLVMLGGWRILEKIRAMGFRSHVRRPTLSALDGPRLLWRAARFSPRSFRPDRLQ